MAQYKDLNGDNFGNGLGTGTTFKIINSGSNTGNIYLSGSGGYVNSPTGITKAALDAGINVKFENDSMAVCNNYQNKVPNFSFNRCETLRDMNKPKSSPMITQKCCFQRQIYHQNLFPLAGKTKNNICVSLISTNIEFNA